MLSKNVCRLSDYFGGACEARGKLTEGLLLGVLNVIEILALSKMLCYIRRGVKPLIFCVDRVI